MTRVYYYVPEDGDIELQPNVFEMSKSIDNIKLKDIKENFPLTGQYIYRFKRSFKSTYVWVDQLNDSESLPQFNSKIFMKVTRTGGSLPLPTPQHTPPSQTVEASPRTAPPAANDVKPAPKTQPVPQPAPQPPQPAQPQVQTQPQPQPPSQPAPIRPSKTSSNSGKSEPKKAPVVVKPEPEIDLFNSDVPQNKPHTTEASGEKEEEKKKIPRGRMNTSELLDIDFSGGSPSFAPQAAPPPSKKDIFNSNSGKGLGALDSLF